MFESAYKCNLRWGNESHYFIRVWNSPGLHAFLPIFNTILSVYEFITCILLHFLPVTPMCVNFYPRSGYPESANAHV